MLGSWKNLGPWALLLPAMFAAPAVVRADAPQIIPIQGYLTDANGAPIDGGVRLDFALFDAATSGTELYSETHNNVDVDAGQFITYLGNEGSPLDLSLFRDNGGLWLEITVDTTDVITPRTHLATMPFAGFAQYCGEAANALQADNATTADSATTADMATMAESISSADASHADTGTILNIGAGQTVGLDTRAAIPGLQVTFDKKHVDSRLWVIATVNVRVRFDHGDRCDMFLTASGAGYSGDYAVGEIFQGSGADVAGHQQATIQRLLPATDQTGSVTLTVEGMAIDDGADSDAVCYFGHRTTSDLFVMEVQ